MNDLFEPTNQIDQNQIDPNKDYVEELVGDNKKFKTLQDLAKAKVESDNYIKTLEQGRDQLREDYLKALEAAQTGPQVKEMLDQLLSGNSNNSNAPTPANDVNAPQLDSNKAKEIARQTYEELEAQRKAEQNYNAVEDMLKKAYGPNYRETFQQKVRELGLSMDWARDTALRHPQALYRTLGIEQTQVQAPHFQAPPASNQRSDSFAPSVVKRDWDFYENMRKNNPTLYWNPKTQVQLHQDSRNSDFRTPSWNS